MSQVNHNPSAIMCPNFLDLDWQLNTTFIPKNKIVQLRINKGKVELARKAKSTGGKWNNPQKHGNSLFVMFKLRDWRDVL